MKVMIILLLLGAIAFNPPYGYYQIMRIGLMWLFFKFAMKAYENEQHALSVVCGLAVCLFQPLIKVAFNRHQWENIDTATALLMIVWCVIDVRNYRSYNY